MKVRNLLVLITALVLMNSCKKKKEDNQNNTVTEVLDVRTEGSTKLVALQVSTGSETATAITLKAVGNSNVHVKISLDTIGIGALGLTKMRAGAYSMTTLEYDVAANGTTIVPIVVDKNLVSVDTTYGIRFRIETISAGTIATDANSIIVRIGMRNRWDGRYRVTGTLTDLFQPAFVFVEHETYLVTTSSTQVKMIPKALGIPAHLLQNGINLTYYGSFGPVMTFDPTTNNITSVVNFYGQPSPAPSSRSAELDPSGLNKWDPTTKNVTIKYWMNSPSLSPHHTAFNNVWVYLGPR